MKDTVRTILVAIFAGFVGAYAYQLVFTERVQAVGEQPLLEENFLYKNVKKDPLPPINEDLNFVAASALSTPSVVYIKTVFDRYTPTNIFDFYFGDGQRSRKSIGSGSGVIFTSDGYIVTNYHVVEDAERIEVIHQKKTYEARLIGTDPSSDLAIIKIESKNLPAVKRGSSKDLRVGEWVIAVGNPFNLQSTVTAGIVSAKGRNIDLLGGQFPLESFIQTDAAINPGNSGGALVNARGELVGINTAILSRTGSYTGYGFAVPIDIVAKIFNDIISHGEVQKSFIGVTVKDIDSEADKKYNLDLESYEGALVTQVQANSVASQAGIIEGTVILKINNDEITGKSSFEEFLSYYRPGEKIKITFLKNKKTQEATLILTNRNGTTEILKNEIYTSEKLGVDLEPLSKIEKDKLKIGEGVRIVKVRRGLFSKLGIEENFIITSINKVPITEPSQVEKILTGLSGKVYIEAISPNGVKGYYQYYF